MRWPPPCAAAQGGDPLRPVTVVVPTNTAGVMARRALGRRGGFAAVDVRDDVPPRRAARGAGPRTPPAASRCRPRSSTSPCARSLHANPGLYDGVQHHPSTIVALRDLYRELRVAGPGAVTALARTERGGEPARVAAEVMRTLRTGLVRRGRPAGGGDQPRRHRPAGPVVARRRPPPPAAATARAAAAAARSASVAPSTWSSASPATRGPTPTSSPWPRRSPTGRCPTTARPIGARRAVGGRPRCRIDHGCRRRGAHRRARGRRRGACRHPVRPHRHPVPERPAVRPPRRAPARRGRRAVERAAGHHRRRADGAARARRAARARSPRPAPHRADGACSPTCRPMHDGRRAPTALWERIGRDAGVVRGDDWEPALTRYADEARRQAAADGRPPVEADAALGLLRFVTELQCRPRRPGALRPWAEWRAWAGRASLERWFGPGRLDRLDGAEGQAWAQTSRVLDRLEHLDGIGGPVTRAEFRATFMAELDVTPGRHGKLGDGVHVSTLAGAVGLDVDVVVVLGAAEGLLPPAPVTDPLLGDRERAAAGSGAGRTTSPRSCTASSSPPPPPRHGPSSPCPVATSGRPRSDRAPAGSIPCSRSAPSGSSTRTPRAWRRPPSRCRRASTACASCGSAPAPATTSAELPVATADTVLRRALALRDARASDDFTVYDGNLIGHGAPALPGARVADAARGMDGLPARLLRPLRARGAADRGAGRRRTARRRRPGHRAARRPRPAAPRRHRRRAAATRPDRLGPGPPRPPPAGVRRGGRRARAARSHGLGGVLGQRPRPSSHDVLDAWVADENDRLARVADRRSPSAGSMSTTPWP